MLAVIVEHRVKAGQMENARARIDTNSEAMAGRDGLYARMTSVPAGRPDWVVTVTIWRDKAALADWNRHKSSLDLPEAGALYEEVRKMELDGCVLDYWVHASAGPHSRP